MASSATRTQTSAGRGGTPKAARRATSRIVIQYPSPSVDDGRYPAKRCVGDRVTLQADVFRDGHELIRATVRYRAPAQSVPESLPGKLTFGRVTLLGSNPGVLPGSGRLWVTGNCEGPASTTLPVSDIGVSGQCTSGTIRRLTES